MHKLLTFNDFPEYSDSITETFIRKIKENYPQQSTTKSTGGRNDTLKRETIKLIKEGIADDNIAKQLLAYDKEKHIVPLFSDTSDNQMKNGDPETNALKFIRSIRKSVGIPEKEYDKTALLCLANIEAEKVEFIWEPFIPRGKTVMLEGNPGVGKSFLTMFIAKTISRGESFPGCDNKRKPQNVLILSAEDDPADTLVPRLIKMDADRNYIHSYPEILTFDQAGVEFIGEILERLKPEVVIIDPIQCYLGSKDSNKMEAVRSVMAPLAKLSTKYNCTIILVRHLNKGNGNALYRGMGSIDFTAAVRSVLTIAENPDKKEEKVVFHIKCNIAKKGSPFSYTVEDGIFTYGGDSPLDVDKVFSENPTKESKVPKLEAAKLRVYELLSTNNGEYASTGIYDDLSKIGIAKRTVDRALKELDLDSKKIGDIWFRSFKD